jgi:hypothetical protein
MGEGETATTADRLSAPRIEWARREGSHAGETPGTLS